MWSVTRRTCGWLCVFGSLAVSAVVALHIEGAIGDDPKAAPLIAKASAEEIAILERHVAAFEQLFNKVDVLRLVGARGGEDDKLDLVATKLFAARAELAIARGELDNALKHQQDADRHAEQSVESATAAWEAGTCTFCDLLEVNELRRDCALKLVELRQKAAVK